VVEFTVVSTVKNAVIRFVSTSAQFGISIVVVSNETLVDILKLYLTHDDANGNLAL